MRENNITPEVNKSSGDFKNLFVLNRRGGNVMGAGSRIAWSEEQVDYIIMHYNINHNVKELANLFSTSQETMRKLLHKQGIKTILTSDKGKELRPRNSDYFETIDTPDKAYWLGFLYADGYINEEKHFIRINLQRKDEAHLYKFLKSIGATNTTVKRTAKHTLEKTYEGSYVIIGDKKLVYDLVDKGCVQNKSLIIKFPTEEQVPKELLSHFIRGYYDGDGSISYKTNKKTFLKYFQVGILGTKCFLEGVQNYLGKSDLKLENRGTHFSLKLGGNRVVYNTLNILYQGSNENIELTRKREKYDLLAMQRHTVKTYSTSIELKEVS